MTIGWSVTADTARELGLGVDAIATDYTIAGLVDVLEAVCRDQPHDC